MLLNSIENNTIQLSWLTHLSQQQSYLQYHSARPWNIWESTLSLVGS